ncbi:MAG: S8 family serine peptidase [Bacteroidales bacterium]
MKKAIITGMFLMILLSMLKAQDKYWVFFTDKEGVSFDPYEYFDQKAIDRRIAHGVSLYDITDFPVKAEYLRGVEVLADSLSHHSRWFNAVATYAGDEQIRAIGELPYVQAVQAFSERQMQYAGIADYDTTLAFRDGLMLEEQTEELGMSVFQEHGIDGEGVRVAVFDGGFPGVDEIPVFEHIRENNRILKTYDFAKDRIDVYHGMRHGTMVLSNIAGKIGSRDLGMAPQAEFLLARTEIRREPFSEEENWMAAMEWADKHGAQIINSSLGYIYHRYFPEQMDGTHSLVAKAANMAAAKGMLVINAAGNNGNDDFWKVIGTPADADSVLAVGGIDPNTGYRIRFSSFGPTADMRMKPNVSAFGKVIVAGKNELSHSFGTSFAAPLVTGFAACALQAKPELKAMELFREIEKSGRLYPYFDYAHGFGVPQADHFVREYQEPEKTFKFVEKEDRVLVNVREEVFENQEHSTRFLLFYNFEEPSGVLYKYYVVSVHDTEVLNIDRTEVPEGCKINVHYVGYTDTFEFD